MFLSYGCFIHSGQYECKEWQEALNVLDMLDMSFTRASSTLNTSISHNAVSQDEKGGGDTMLLSNVSTVCELQQSLRKHIFFSGFTPEPLNFFTLVRNLVVDLVL